MRFRLASIAELSVFLYHVIDLTKNEGMKVTSSGPSPLCSWLIYDPYRRYEVSLQLQLHLHNSKCYSF